MASKGTAHYRSHAQKSEISGTPETRSVSQWTGGTKRDRCPVGANGKAIPFCMLASLGAVPLTMLFPTKVFSLERHQ